MFSRSVRKSHRFKKSFKGIKLVHYISIYVFRPTNLNFSPLDETLNKFITFFYSNPPRMWSKIIIILKEKAVNNILLNAVGGFIWPKID